MIVQERYKPILMTANSSYVLNTLNMGGFLANTDGNITVTAINGAVLVSAHPVTAGVYYPIPILLGNGGATVALAGGASGTLLV